MKTETEKSPSIPDQLAEWRARATRVTERVNRRPLEPCSDGNMDIYGPCLTQLQTILQTLEGSEGYSSKAA